MNANSLKHALKAKDTAKILDFCFKYLNSNGDNQSSKMGYLIIFLDFPGVNQHDFITIISLVLGGNYLRALKLLDSKIKKDSLYIDILPKPHPYLGWNIIKQTWHKVKYLKNKKVKHIHKSKYCKVHSYGV